MIILLIAEERNLKTKFQQYFGRIGYSVIQYSNPLKAMDNLEEISPDVVICNTSDYPRHWKIVVKQIREKWDRTEVIAVLLVTDTFDFDETDKAATLGVNILSPSTIETIEDFENLNNKIRRYKSPSELFKISSWLPQNPVPFAFSHPKDSRMITGYFVELTTTGGVFHSNEPGEIADIEVGSVIKACSMKIGFLIFSLQVRVGSNSGTISSMEFIDFEGDGYETFLNVVNQHLK